MKRLLFILLTLINAGIIYGQGTKQKVAIYTDDKSGKKYAAFAGEFLTNSIVKRGVYDAYERTADFLKLLTKEHNYQRSGSVSENEIAKLGAQLGVQLVCAVKIDIMDGQPFISAKLIDVETSRIESTARPAMFKAGDFDGFEAACEKITASMFGERGSNRGTNTRMSGNAQHSMETETDVNNNYSNGVAARAAGDDEKAAGYFKQAIDAGYVRNGDMYALYAEALLAAGDTTAAQNSLTQGLELYPDNQNIIVGLINLFLQKGEDPKKILPYVHKAQQNDPANATLYYAEGLVYEQLKDSEKAAKAYKTAIEKDPKNFFANYSLGALYFNKAVQTNQVAADELDDTKYEALMKVFDNQLRQALPYLEQAYELNSSDRVVVESLKTIYFRFRGESPEMEKKYEFYNTKLQGM